MVINFQADAQCSHGHIHIDKVSRLTRFQNHCCYICSTMANIAKPKTKRSNLLPFVLQTTCSFRLEEAREGRGGNLLPHEHGMFMPHGQPGSRVHQAGRKASCTFMTHAQHHDDRTGAQHMAHMSSEVQLQRVNWGWAVPIV